MVLFEIELLSGYNTNLLQVTSVQLVKPQAGNVHDGPLITEFQSAQCPLMAMSL